MEAKSAIALPEVRTARWHAGGDFKPALPLCRVVQTARSKRKAALAKFQGRAAAKRRDHLHKVARKLVTRFGRIGIEDLNIKGLTGGMLAKHVHDAAWAQLTAMLDYKAASAGVELVKVDPRGTSQTCPECGIVAAKTLAEREHRMRLRPRPGRCCSEGCALQGLRFLARRFLARSGPWVAKRAGCCLA